MAALAPESDQELLIRAAIPPYASPVRDGSQAESLQTAASTQDEIMRRLTKTNEAAAASGQETGL